MLKIRIGRSNRRGLFEKPFYQLELKITILNKYFVFIGSSKDDIFQKEEFSFQESNGFDYKINQIKNYINPMTSTTLLNDQPFIPGSTIKGMIRFNLEHSFKSDDNNNIYCCFIKQDNPQPKNLIENFLKLYGYWPNIPEERQEENLGNITRECCKVCDLFGNTDLASRIIFSDAVPLTTKALEYIEIEVKGGISRKRVIPPDSQFIFKINMNNGTDEDLALLYIGMNLHKDGTLFLGMYKFSSKKDPEGNELLFGKIKVEITKITKYEYSKQGDSEESINIQTFNDKMKEFIKNNFKNILRN